MNKTKRPTFSIVTAVYNGAKTVEETIISVLGQDFDDFEYIIIDGGSNDGTVDIVRRYESRLAYFVSEPDGGIYSAWNKGLRAAKGEWIAFLGADDTYVPTALSQYARFIRRQGNEDLEYVSSQLAFTKAGRTVRIYGNAWAWGKFRRAMNVGHVGSMHSQALFDRLGGYDDSFEVCGDYELLLRARDTLRAEFMPVVTTLMSVEGVSNRRLRQSFTEMALAKSRSGGRPIWLCFVESVWDYLKARIRSLIWY